MYNLLETINDPADLRRLDAVIATARRELREFILDA